MKIMIVDDHADMRRVLKSILKGSIKETCDIVECDSGEDALLGYGFHNPDCVLMDIELKKMDGFETSSKISERYPSAKIVFVSSHDTLKFRKYAEKLHAIGFVSKDNLSDIPPILQTINTKTPLQ